MKQKPVPIPSKPKPEKTQQSNKKEASLEQIRSKINEMKDLVSKSDLVMQGHIEHLLMKLNVLEKEISNDKNNIAGQQKRINMLEKQSKTLGLKEKQKQQNNTQQNVSQSTFNYPVLSPTYNLIQEDVQSGFHTMKLQLGTQSSYNNDTKRLQEKLEQLEMDLQNVLLTNIDLLEKNDRLKKEIDSAQKTKVLICQVCHKNEREVLFMPCNHVLTCSACSNIFTTCMTCHSHIKDKRIVFF
uniref:RING-type domain-containing protein n=1 Tax=Acrobeloides nanus TaxID=290746 RepID=A0A914DT99_9BILA